MCEMRLPSHLYFEGLQVTSSSHFEKKGFVQHRESHSSHHVTMNVVAREGPGVVAVVCCGRV